MIWPIAAAAGVSLGALTYIFIRKGVNRRSSLAVMDYVNSVLEAESLGNLHEALEKGEGLFGLFSGHGLKEARVHARARASLGAFMFRVGEYEKSRALFEPGLRLLSKMDRKGSLPVVALVMLARITSREGGIEEAERLFSEAERLLEKRLRKMSSQDLADAMDEIANYHFDNGRLEKADAAMDRAILACENNPEGAPFKITCLLNGGEIKEEMGDIEAAIELFDQALDLAWRRDDAELLVAVADRIADFYQCRRDPEEELRYWESRLERANDECLPYLSMAVVTSRLSDAMVGLAMVPAAESLILDLISTLPPPEEEPLALAVLLQESARLARWTGRSGEAISDMKKALDLMSRAGVGDSMIASGMIDLADLYRSFNMPARSAAILEDAIGEMKKSKGGNHPDLAWACLKLAEARLDTGEPEKAEDACLDCAAALEASGQEGELRARAAFYLGVSRMENGDYPAAKESLGECLKLLEEKDDPSLASMAWFNMSIAHQALGEMNRALSSIQGALRGYESEEIEDKDAMGEMFARLSSIHAGMGDHEQSIKYADMAMTAWAEEKRTRERGPAA